MKSMRQNCRQSWVVFTALLVMQPVLAQPDVLFVDGGFVEMCESAARQGEEATRIVVTGSRLGVTPLEICSFAVNAPDADATQKAASHNNRGVVKFAEGDLDGALADFDAALVLKEGLGQAQANRGYVFMAKRDWQAAIAAFDQGLMLGTEDAAKAHFNRAVAHEELGHVRDAYNDYRKANELDPEWEAPKVELTRFTIKR